jgi:hypothetical protein
MSYATNKGQITAKKGKAEDAPSVSIQDPLYQEGNTINDWVEVYGEEVVKEVFLQARQVIIQRVGRGILKDDGSNVEEAQAAMIAQCSDLSLKRTAAPKVKGLTRAQAEAAIVAKGFDITSPKVQKIFEAIFASK